MDLLPVSTRRQRALDAITHASPLRGSEQDGELIMYQVIIALNVWPPLRSHQEYLWLEVLAPTPSAALHAAERWTRSTALEEVEVSGLVRERSPLPTVGLPINWQIVVRAGMPDGNAVRHPVSGLRVGWTARADDEQLWLDADQRRHFRLIVRRPVDGAEALMLAPIVHRVDW